MFLKILDTNVLIEKEQCYQLWENLFLFLSFWLLLIIVGIQTLSRKTNDDGSRDNYKVDIWGFLWFLLGPVGKITNLIYRIELLQSEVGIDIGCNKAPTNLQPTRNFLPMVRRQRRSGDAKSRIISHIMFCKGKSDQKEVSLSQKLAGTHIFLGWCGINVLLLSSLINVSTIIWPPLLFLRFPLTCNFSCLKITLYPIHFLSFYTLSFFRSFFHLFILSACLSKLHLFSCLLNANFYSIFYLSI